MQKSIEEVKPRLGERGTSVEVIISGLSLADPREIIFDSPGITVSELSYVPREKPRGGFPHGGLITGDVHCTFQIAPDCAVGEHRFRLLTGTELSHLATFHVSPFPVIESKEVFEEAINDSIETAESVPLNRSVRGIMGDESTDDRDLYRVTMKKGQRLSVEIDSARISDKHYGDSEFDLMVRFLNPKGKEIARNDDNTFGVQDPCLSRKIDFDGDVVVEVKRSIYAKRTTEYYLHVGDFPAPTIAFPAGGEAGSETEVTFLGDGAGPFRKKVTFHSDPGTFREDTGGPTGVTLRSSTYPNLMEGSPVSSLPVALNGRLEKRGEVDEFPISVAEGDRLRIRVQAFASGSPIDSVIQIRKGKELIEEHDDATIETRDIYGTSYRGGTGVGEIIDPSFVWEPKEAGDYTIRILDRSGQEGPLGVYRIEVEPMRTQVLTALKSKTFDWTESMRVSGMAVPQGNRWTVNVMFPKGQWDAPKEPFRLVAEGLPKGISMISQPVPPGTREWPIQLVAAKDAPIGGGVFNLRAEGIETHNQHHAPFINHSGGSAWRRVSTDAYFTGVTDPAPFSIEIEMPRVDLVREAARSIPVKIKRHGEFTGPVLVSMGFIHGAIDYSPDVVIPEGETEAELTLTARGYAPLEPLPLVVTGSTINDQIDPFLGVGAVRVSTRIVEVLVSEPYLKLTAEPQSVRRNGQGKFVWSLTQQQPFTGKATATLLGLPKGVTIVKSSSITKESTEAVFELAASDEALLGTTEGLECEITFPVEGSPIVQRTGKASLRIDPKAE